MTITRSFSDRLAKLSVEMTLLDNEIKEKIGNPISFQYKIQDEYTPIMELVSSVVLSYRAGKLKNLPDDFEFNLSKLNDYKKRWESAVAVVDKLNEPLKEVLKVIKAFASELEELRALGSTTDDANAYVDVVLAHKKQIERITNATKLFNGQVKMKITTLPVFAQLEAQGNAIVASFKRPVTALLEVPNKTSIYGSSYTPTLMQKALPPVPNASPARASASLK